MEEYLGDGVYATADYPSIKLDLRGQDNATVIYLEPAVITKLFDFHKNMLNHFERSGP